MDNGQKIEPLEERFALTLTQQDIYFDQCRHPDSPLYNVGGYIKINRVDLDKLRAAHKLLVQTQAPFGIRIVSSQVNLAQSDNLGVEQYISQQRNLDLPLVDYSKEHNPHKAATDWLKQQFETPLDIEDKPLFKSVVIKLNNESFWYVGFAHHLAMDGWGFANWAKKLGQIYNQELLAQCTVQDIESNAEQSANQWHDVALKDQQYVAGKKYQSDKAFWAEQTGLTPDRLLTAISGENSQVSNRKLVAIDSELLTQVYSFAKNQNISASSIFLAAISSYFSQVYGQNDMVFGLPAHNRRNHIQKQMLGVFTSISPMAVQLPNKINFIDLVKSLTEQQKQNFRHQRYPIGHIINDLQIGGEDKSLYDICYNYLSLDSQLSFEGQQAQLVYLSHNHNTTPLTITVWQYGAQSEQAYRESEERSEGYSEIQIDYNYAYFDDFKAEQLGQNLTFHLQQLLANAHLPVEQAEFLDKQQQALLHQQLNENVISYPQDVLIHQLFERQVQQNPNQIALSYHCEQSEQSEQISYAQLNSKANQLARFLRQYGVVNDTFVGIATDRGIDMVVAVLATLKAGGAYVSLDLNYPKQRLNNIVTDSQMKVVLTLSHAQEVVSDICADFDATTIVCLDNLAQQLAKLDTDNLPLSQNTGESPSVQTSADSIAYLIYTSGSTGKPKGVAVRHRNATAMLHWANSYYSKDELARVLASTSLSFDLSVFELFVPLSFGFECVLVNNALELLNQDIKVSLINTVPSAIKVLMAQNAIASTVKVINLAGEPLSASVVNGLLSGEFCNKVCNLYGPSEDTTYSTCAHYTQTIDSMVSIGKPIANTQAYVLNSQQKLLPAGVVGELYLAGDGVAKGYLNQEALSAERFIDNPFTTGNTGKLYRTGDLVYVLTDDRQTGNLAFVGRVDDQVKVRGHRIELGEIEHQLSQLKAVASSLVVAKSLSSSDTSEPQIVAYVALQQQNSEDINLPQRQLADKLNQQLSEVLPQYMLPAAFVFIDQWPLLPNGKINRKALPTPNLTEQMTQVVEPTNQIQQQLLDIFAALLNLQSDKFSCTANFFNFGGHSLLAAKLIAQVRVHFNVDISLKQVFENPTVLDLAAVIEKSEGQNLPSAIVKQHYQDTAPLSLAQQRLWFVDNFEGSSEHYNMPCAFEVEGPFSLDRAAQAFTKIIERHQVLRTVYRQKEQDLEVTLATDAQQLINPPTTFALARIDLTHIPEAQQQAKIKQLAIEDAQAAFDLSADLMIRACWLDCDNRPSHKRGVLLINMHHIACDGWSVKLLVNEFISLYQGNDDNLEPMDLQYADYAIWQQQYLQSSSLNDTSKSVRQQQLDYWLPQLADIPAEHSLPLDYSRPAKAQYQGAVVTGIVNCDDTARLDSLATELGITPFMLMHGLFSLLLSRHSNSKDIVLGTTSANRMQAQTANIIGFFVSTLVLRVDCDSSCQLTDYFAQIKKVNLDAMEHQDLPFEDLVEHLPHARAQNTNPVFQIMLTMDNDGLTDLQHLATDGLRFTPLNTDVQGAKFDITLDFSWTERGIKLNWVYDKALFAPARIEQLNEQLLALLSSIMTVKPQSKLCQLNMLTEKQQQYLRVELNQTEQNFAPQIDPKSVLIHELFERQVQLTPDAVAVQFTDRQAMIDRGTVSKLSYQQLNQRSNQLAHYLRSKGVDAGVRVGVCLERSTEMFIAIMATLKAGGIFVPIDPNYPTARIQHMVADSAITELLTMSNLSNGLLFDNDIELIEVDKYQHLSENCDNLPRSQAQNPNNLAYVIYTSGSTGKPKGVECYGASALNLLHQFEQLAPINQQADEQSNGVFMWTSVSFDVAIYEMFSALVYGRSLHLSCDELRLDTNQLFEYLLKEQILSTYLPPFMIKDFVTWLENRKVHNLPMPKLQRLLVGVEAILLKDLQRIKALVPTVTIINGYGPSEATVCASLYVIDDKPQQNLTFAPIGRPVNNCQLLVLDEQLQLTPLGSCGELYIGGAGLAKGYINQAQQTNERFILNPFDGGKTRLYRTGDIVRYVLSEDSTKENLLFVGRIDEQVKINGLRIELGEIETQLSALNEVQSCNVLVDERADGQAGSSTKVKSLLAYVEPNKASLGLEQDAVISAKQQAQICGQLRLELRNSLPEHMIPTGFVLVDEWPFTVNGKLDKKALLAMELVGSEYVPPSNDTERELVDLVSSTIDINANKLSVTTSFFELGLSSLKLFAVISAVNQKFSINLSPKEIYNKSTIQLLAAYVSALHLTTLISCDDEDESFEEDGEI